MAIKDNNRKSNLNNVPTENFRHIRANPITGGDDYYFPMEITDPSIRLLAQDNELEITRTRLGNRVIDAVMVPCKDTVTIKGREVYVDTRSDKQRERYLSYIRDELAAQDAARQDGRCNISNGHGGTKRCPCRTLNPDYTSGSDKPKTIPVRCEGCIYEPFRRANTFIELSALDQENDSGEVESYEIPSQKSYFAADRYLEIRERFIAFVRERNPKLVPLAELLTDEFTKSEAARELGQATSTVGSRTDKLKDLLNEFLDNLIVF